MSDDIVMPIDSYGTAQIDTGSFELDGAEVSAAFSATGARPLGRGAFGETWRLDLSDGTRRAVKVLLNPDYSKARLEREVEGLRRASSVYVVDLLDAVAVHVGGHERAALVFEYIAGGDVASHLAVGVRLAPATVTTFAQGLFVGLAALHRQDTIHRDIKPENIAIRDGDWARPVLLDLGLARVLDRASITAYPSLIGTAPYMAPEQLRLERARKAADVFAAGVVLHLMLAGEHPFYAGQPGSITLSEAIKLIEAGPAALPVDVPEPLAKIVRRLLSVDEADRGSARRARRDLASCAEALGLDSDEK